MLAELFIRNLALVDSLHLTFGRGFNALTGETGAGKSIIVDAMTLLAGGRAAADMIRAGAEEARVEGVFDLGDAPLARRVLGELGMEADGGDVLVVTREIARNGRSMARLNGRPVALTTLRQVAEGLLDIHGQHEFQRLFRLDAQRDILDAYGGKEVLDLRRRVGEAAGRLAAWQRQREQLAGDEQERLRRLDLLRFQVEEIDAARLSPGEEEELLARRAVLANAERLLAGTAAAVAALYEGGAGRPALAAELARLAAELSALGAWDGQLAPYGEQLQAVAWQVEEVARALRRYRDGIAVDPAELAAVEERLDLLRRLKKKYGDTVAQVLQYREEAAAELDRLAAAEETAAGLEERLAQARRELAALAGELSSRRQAAARAMEARVEAELAELGMEGARFQVEIARQPRDGGLAVGGAEVAWDASGIDRVEFLFSANPGEPPRPLTRVASGGEAARLMLALKTVLAEADQVPTLVFDEVDTGIGGRAALVVGRKLAGLARVRQVFCVTHLAAVAARADVHYRVAKGGEGGRTVVSARRLAPEERVAEIARMLGGGAGEAALEHARAMLAEAARPGG